MNSSIIQEGANKISFSLKRSDSYEQILYDPEDYSINHRHQTYMESFLDFLTNSRYNILNTPYLPLFSNCFITITPSSPTVILLGKIYRYNPEISLKELNDQLKRSFNSIIWFTYRRNFPILKPQSQNKDYISDTGWGCMIRAGQMMWAEVLKRFLKAKSHKEIVDIIRLFLDSEVKMEKAPYSIQQISQVAAKNFNIVPGDWYKATTIIMSLEECYENYNRYMSKLQEIKKDNNELAFAVFPDGCIFVDKILEKVTKTNSHCIYCKNQSKKNIMKETKNNIDNNHKNNNNNHNHEIDNNAENCKENHNDENNNGMKYISNKCNECSKWEKSLFLLVCLRLGSTRPNPEYFPMMKYLINSSFSVGVLGGRPRRALYFVGYQDDNLIIQDPHYVQDSVPSIDNLGKTHFLSSYFNEEIRGFPMESMDSSIAFGFYIENEQEFKEFYEYVRKGEEKLENWCLGLQMEFVCEDFEEACYQEENKEDEYEVLGYKE